MSGPFPVFELHLYRGMFCRHELLLRAVRPSASNADQGMEDAADAFADSALLHLRSWWERYRLPLDCRANHRVTAVGRMAGPAVGDALYERGLRQLDVWVARTPDDPPWLVVGAAGTEEEFWQEVEDAEMGANLHRPARQHSVYLLTDRDGDGDLRDS